MRGYLKKQERRLWPIADQLIVSGTNFIVGLIIARYCGVSIYGTYALYWTIYLFLQGFCNAFIGLPAQVVSNQQKNKAHYLETNNHLGNVLLIGVFGLLIVGFSIYDYVINVSFGVGYWLFPIVIVLFLKQEMNRKYFYAKEQMKKVVLIDATAFLLQLPLLLVVLFYDQIDLNKLLIIMLICGGISQLFFFSLKTKWKNKFSWKELPIKENWKYAKYLIFTVILQWFSGNVFLFSAAGILGTAAVGIIRVLQNIMGVLHILFLTLENVVPPKAAFLLNQHGKSYMIIYLKKVILITGGIYGALLIMIKLFGAHILAFLYGEGYTIHADLLNIYLLVYVFVFIGTIAQITIKTMNLNQGILWAYICSVCIAFLAAKPLVTNYQLEGVIIGFGLLQLITLSVYLVTLKKAWT